MFYKIREKLAKMRAESRKENEKLYKIAHGHERKPLNTTKVFTAFIFVNCVILEIYSMIAMLIIRDLSPLVTMLGALMAEIASLWSYSYKATKENCVGGITYESAKQNWDNNAAG